MLEMACHWMQQKLFLKHIDGEKASLSKAKVTNFVCRFPSRYSQHNVCQDSGCVNGF